MDRRQRSSGLDLADKAGPLDQHPDMPIYSNQPSHLQRNKTERRRLQGLMRSTTRVSEKTADDRSSRIRTFNDQWNAWMVNDGGRRIFFGVFVFLHLLVFGLGFVHYQLKDNSDNARALFGPSFPLARTAALVLHVDIIFILLPVCRNFISMLRRTSLNMVIPFDENITFHKSVAWSIVFFTAVHIIAHMVNFAKLAAADPDVSIIKFTHVPTAAARQNIHKDPPA